MEGKTIFNWLRYVVLPLSVIPYLFGLGFVTILINGFVSVINLTNFYGYKLSNEERRNFIPVILLQVGLFVLSINTNDLTKLNVIITIALLANLFETEHIRKKMKWELPFSSDNKKQ